jgi:cytochrome c oxidase subunit 2
MKLLGLPLLASKHGAEVDKFIWYVHLLMIALFIGWSAYFLYTIWRFRQSRNPKADYVGTTTHASSYIEGAVAFVEGVLLIGFAIPLWAHSVEKFPPASESTVIRIVAKQFEWLARYPGPDGKFGSNRIDLVSAENPMGLDKSDAAAKDDVNTTLEIAVPVDKPVIAHITSLDVIHSFKVVPLRMTQDANPGMSIPVHFLPTLTNTYQIQCSQLCGNGHSSMRGFFKVLSTNEFSAWLAKKAGGVTSYE